MAAGLGFKDFVTGEVLTAADVDGYLMQGIWVFDDATARDAAVTSPQEGNACYLKDTDAVMTYSGSAWVTVGGASATWTSFTPTRSNITVGNGTEVAKYIKNGKDVDVFYSLTLGSTSSIGSTPSIVTPTTSVQSPFYAGICMFQDTGSGTYMGSALIIGSTVYPQALGSAGTYVNAANPSATIPFTWTNTDVLTMQFSYEEA